MRHPLETHLNPNPGRPTYLAATTDGQGHRRVSHLRSGYTKPGQNPRMSTHCPPIHGLPRPRSDPQDVDDVSMGRADRGSSIAPTDLWCPDGSPPTVRAPPPPLPSRSCPSISPADARAWSSVTVWRHRDRPSPSKDRPPPGRVFRRSEVPLPNCPRPLLHVDLDSLLLTPHSAPSSRLLHLLHLWMSLPEWREEGMRNENSNEKWK